MPLQATAGAATYDAFGGGVTAANYIEDVFSTYLYTGNGSTQTITNGIDLATQGGLVWLKSRTANTGGFYDNVLQDTIRGGTKWLYSNWSDQEGANVTPTISFNNNGFSVNVAFSRWNSSSDTYASWTFRKQPKFFDVVTYTGNGSNRTISHSLGSIPGCIIVKRTDTAADWQVYHRSLANTEYLVLNTTAAKATGTTRWNSTTPTATEFSLGTDTTVNANSGTYVAYLFAHDAGGFGASGTDNVISCGSFTTDAGGNATVTLGYEPQWVMYKRTDSISDWRIHDTMRGWVNSGSIGSGDDAQLLANTSAAESTGLARGFPTATGFTMSAGNSATYIYIAIRRGPMRTPTTGTSVYKAITRTGNGVDTTVTGAGFPVDFAMTMNRSGVSDKMGVIDRLRNDLALLTAVTDAEAATWFPTSCFAQQDGIVVGTTRVSNGNAETYVNQFLRRAPGFFDVVCYTGTGSATTVTHNLGVVPELMIVKRRDSAGTSWCVYSAATTSANILFVNTNAGSVSSSNWNNTAPTASVFSVGTSAAVNASGGTYVAYLFASCPGVSKVGSYTGTGTTLQIDCGFTAGSRFVLIKRTDSTGDWYVWDSARGIVAGNDPYLLLNDTAAEVTSTDYVDTYSAGFEISSTAPAAINANGGTFIFLAIA